MIVKTTVPRSKRFRLGRRIAVLAAAAAVLGITYQLTRPPELVLWKSPQIGKSRYCVRTVMPYGCEPNPGPRVEQDTMGNFKATYSFSLKDRRPQFVRRLFGMKKDSGIVEIVAEFKLAECELSEAPTQKFGYLPVGTSASTQLHKRFRLGWITVTVNYRRTNPRSFNRTYKQICNSLTIE